MKKELLLATFFLALSFTTFAQQRNWRLDYTKENANYYEIVNKQKEAKLSLTGKTEAKSLKELKQLKRWQYIWKDRILPDGSFVKPNHTYNEWLKETQTNSLQGNSNSVNTGPLWSFIGPKTPPVAPVGPYPGMGRVNVIEFSPTNTNTIYIGSPAGGVWKTTDGGTTWASKSDNMPNLGVSDLAINPTNESIIYMATGDFDGMHTPSIGVFKSIDGGNNWLPTGFTIDQAIYSIISTILIDPNNTDTIFATTKKSIKKSTDAGDTWTDVYSDPSKTFNDIEYKTGSSTILYATTSEGSFLKSTDNGDTWTEESTPTTSRLNIAQTANDNNLILGLDASGMVYISTDEGATWTTKSTVADFDSQSSYNQVIAISPLNKDLVIVGGVHGWRSTDGGATWEKYLDGYWNVGNAYFYVHSDHHDIKFRPGTNIAYSGNDGGVFTGDASISTAWTDLSSGLEITQYYSVSGTPQDANKLIMGAQDNDVAVYNGTTFVGKNSGSDGVDGVWDYSNSNIAWTCSQFGAVERTLDGFATESSSISTPPSMTLVWPLEIHPTDPKTLFGAFDNIYKSTDRGDTWTNLNTTLTGEIGLLTISQSDANIIYAGVGTSVEKTVDGGATWNSLTLPQAGDVKSIAIHPTNPDILYMSYAGYTPGKVFKSTDGGENWNDISGNLPNIPVTKIAYRTGSNDEIFLGTDLGVYYKNNTLTEWTKLDNGIPNVIISDLAIHYGTKKLRCATFGRGVWEVSIDNISLGNTQSKIEEKDIKIYPNPTINKKINIDLKNLEGTSSILIYNIIGGVAFNYETNNNFEKIDLSEFAQGMYFVKITNKDKSITKKIILD